MSDFIDNDFLKNAVIGVCIQDMDGNEIISHNKQTSLKPASTLKIITTATALEILGDKFRFKTELAAANPNKLIIRGYGDPTLGSEFTDRNEKDFPTQWKEQIIKKFGNKPIEIEVDDSYFGYDGISNKWLTEDIGNYYASGSYGISIYDNTYRLFLKSKNETKTPRIIKTEPRMIEIKFTNRLGISSTIKENAYIFGEPFSDNRLLTGSVPAGKESVIIKGDIPDPGSFLGKLIARTLQPEINVTDVYTTRTATPSETSGETFFTRYSVPLTDIIRIVNFRSNNHYAEHLLRAVGVVNGKKTNAMREGIEKTADFWQSKGMNTDALFMYDGCGLSPSNAVNPEFLCELLRYMHTKSKYSESFTSSLPEAGKDGTVRNFLKEHNMPGKFLVKSGSIGNVQCYAGYYINGDKKYVFSIMVNNFKKDSRRQTVKAIETFLKDVF